MGPRRRRRSPARVQEEGAIDPDWRDAAAYRPLLAADRSLFAWEWLRREPVYRAAAGSTRDLAAGGRPGRPSAAEFGLVAFEAPGRRVPAARPLWRADVHPPVLAVERGGGGPLRDVFELDSMAGLATLVTSGSGEHLLLSDGLRALRLDGPRGTFSGGPAVLRYRLRGLAAADLPLLTLRRFLALCRTGRFASGLNPVEQRARRWVLMLRAYDGLRTGADQRQLARHLFSESAGEPRWRSRESSVRSQVQRLARSARAMADGGYRAFLC